RRRILECLESVAICSLADIPIMHLSYHARRYGKIAIGFHREAAIRHGFTPVFYQLRHSAVLQAICDGLRLIEVMNVRDVADTIEAIERAVKFSRDAEIDLIASDDDWDQDLAISVLRRKAILNSELWVSGLPKIKTLLAFIKTF